MLKKLKKTLLIFLTLLGLGLFIFYKSVQIFPPEVENQAVLNEKRIQKGENHFQIGNSFLKKNNHGLFEIYVEGSPFERGVRIGKLAEELIAEQETAFISGIEELVPSRNYLNFLKYIAAWQNRNLPDYVNLEFQKEIYGVSFFAADEYDFIGPKFHRKLIYHAAHDIGHTMQNLGLVGCSALSVWGEKSRDSSLILGRNFDFYVGDDFAKNKIVYFIKPDTGFSYASISWPGFIGVVSGMNSEGLAVVLNAGPPAYPGSSKTPVALVAREILQYASTIEEAFEIAKKKAVFVSENIIVASAKDNRSAVIEKTPDQTVLLDENAKYLTCTNHFESAELIETEENRKAAKTTTTIERKLRISELVSEYNKMDLWECAHILRDVKAKNNVDIGLGNEMALNQLLAHHSVIFKPQKRQMWVSTSPWQFGAFVGYDLGEIFNKNNSVLSDSLINQIPKLELTIPPDMRVQRIEFANFLEFRKTKEILLSKIENKESVSEEILENFETLNPEHYLTYEILGDYFKSRNDCETALKFYKKGFEKVIPDSEKEEYLEKVRGCGF